MVRSPATDAGLKAASFVSAPPHFAPRAGWVVIRCAGVATLVPVSSHLRAQGLQRVANASFVASATWIATTLVQGARTCPPSVRPPFGTTMANSVAHFVASAPDYVGVQAFLAVQL